MFLRSYQINWEKSGMRRTWDWAEHHIRTQKGLDNLTRALLGTGGDRSQVTVAKGCTGDKKVQAEEGTALWCWREQECGWRGMWRGGRVGWFLLFLLFYSTILVEDAETGEMTVGVGTFAGVMSLMKKNGMDGIHIPSRDVVLFTSKNNLLYRREFRENQSILVHYYQYRRWKTKSCYINIQQSGFRSKENYLRWRGHSIMIKGSIYQDDIWS